MNKYTKILKKMLAIRIQQHIKWIIYHNQFGFTPVSQAWLKLINVIHYINKRQKSHDYPKRCRKII